MLLTDLLRHFPDLTLRGTVGTVNGGTIKGGTVKGVHVTRLEPFPDDLRGFHAASGTLYLHPDAQQLLMTC